MYRAKKVYESLGFQRGQSPKQALNIGLRPKISSWLDKMEIKNYTINDDFTIDVNGNVDLWRATDENWPSFIKFGKVSGFFDCDHNNLTSLEGAPRSIGGDFNCGDNNLASLEGAPGSIGGTFYCRDNNLTSLKGAPQSVEGTFSCSYNKLTSLEGAPQSVGGNFFCDNNKVQFTEEDVRKVSNVGGRIYV